MPDSETKKVGETIPSWAYVLALFLGVPLAGGGSAILGAQASTEDLQRLERKVDALDEKLDSLEIAIVRAHASDPGFSGGRTP